MQKQKAGAVAEDSSRSSCRRQQQEQLQKQLQKQKAVAERRNYDGSRMQGVKKQNKDKARI